MSAFSIVSLFFRTFLVVSPESSTWNAILVWMMRLITFSFLFRTFLGPTILRLVSKRLRVRSISIRSIRGIYFHAGIAILRVDRVGVSYHRRCIETASRFSIKVEGLQLELLRKHRCSPRQSTSSSHSAVNYVLSFFPSVPAIERTSSILRSLFWTIYFVLEPHARPPVRVVAVSAIRLGIRALLALTQVLDFELDSATVTVDSLVGAELNIRGARLSTGIKISHADSPIDSQEQPTNGKGGHKRFNSVVEWNARVRSSLRRSWNRAWGATTVHTSVNLNLAELYGQISSNLATALQIGSIEDHLVFFKVPDLRFELSARVDQHGIQQHSLGAALGLDSITMDLSTMSRTLDLLKTVNPATHTASMILEGDMAPTRSPREAWATTMSGNTALMGVISASMRFRRNLKKPPVRKLDTRLIVSKLSFLKAIQINITRITIKHRTEVGPDRTRATLSATLRRININTALSHPGRNPLHREWLGRNAAVDDPLNASVYAFGFSVREASLDRIGSGVISDHLRLVSLGPLTVEAVVSQWPAPWLRSPTFMNGDPNSQVLLIQVSLDKVEMTERLEVLQAFLERRTANKPVPAKSPIPEILSPIPRIQIGVHVGAISARLISPTSEVDEKPFALELRNEGLLFNAASYFTMLFDDIPKRETDSDYPRLQMDFGFDLALQQTFVTMSTGVYVDLEGPKAASPRPSGESILSLDVIQVVSEGQALGHMAEVPGTIVSISVPSAFMQTHVYTDALSIELWQPDAIVALSSVAHALNVKRRQVEAPTKCSFLDQMLPGIDLSVSITRTMVYITGKDLTPEDDLGISRGVAAHAGISLHYCSLTGQHVRRMLDLSRRKERRLKLSLPDELTSTALSRATASTAEIVAVFLRAKVWDVAVRDAVATPFVADDSYGSEDTNKRDKSREFFTIRDILLDATVSGSCIGGSPRAGISDDCHASISVSNIRSAIQLGCVYSVLLAVDTVRRIVPESKIPRHSPQRHNSLRFSLSYSVDRVHLLWDFPLKSRLYLRLRSMSGKLSTGHITLSWKSAVLASTVDRERNGRTYSRWEEIGRLLNYSVDVRPDARPLGVTVVGDSARLRIPFGFVLADLILDINISIKCIKHLVYMVPSRQCFNPPSPEPEKAKVMPDLVVRIGCLSAEAADEDFEARLSLIWRAGFEATRLRLEREEAFHAKVATIQAAESNRRFSQELESDFQFTPEHTISIEDARERLDRVHSGAWKSQFLQAHVDQERHERAYLQKNGGHVLLYSADEDIVPVNDPPPVPPLVRITFDHLSLRLTGPSFPADAIPEFLFDAGDGLPRETQYSLLVPMHINFSVTSLRLAYREYPLPLLNIPAHSNESRCGLEFDSDIVVAEEMGTLKSVYWVDCTVLQRNAGIHGAAPLTIAVAKTIMPVKSYAKPVIRVTTDKVSDLAWGVSYNPATQDVMRILDTLSHAPRDSSPPIGFWDKLRLIFHWRFRVYFDYDVHLHIKGSRDPYELRGTGAGFALCWRGRPRLFIGHPNEQRELLQVLSDSMLVAVPNVEDSFAETAFGGTKSQQATQNRSEYRFPRNSPKYRKICAKFTSGVRFGIGTALERTCGPECQSCSGRSFLRKCRFFQFRPHYEVKLEQKFHKPVEKSPDDSYNGFRSDFIHLSLSLASSINSGHLHSFSSIHLSPKLFAHFWAWWTLFDFKAPPIRQGPRYKQKRPLSPKVGQHLATIKYRIAVPKLFISHVYMDESSDAWADGVTPFVGVKAMIDMFQADMHQRAQESTIATPNGASKTIVHKKFYAAEVVMKEVELRALLAIFPEPLKQEVPLETSPLGSSYRTRENIPTIKPDSVWVDLDDFVELDWSTNGIPVLHLLPVVSCPRFTYVKRTQAKHVSGERIDISKFGNEDTHVCLLGTEPSVPQVQIALAEKRIAELRTMANGHVTAKASSVQKQADARKMLPLLEDYVQHLRKADAAARRSTTNGRQSYYMPADSVSPEEWSGFSNVYQVHCPQVIMDNVIRDILLQYYYCSRVRRGMEYHMASRAVKFIRDQAAMAMAADSIKAEKGREPTTGAHAAAMAVRRIFTGEGTKLAVEPAHQTGDSVIVDPMSGWSEGVSLDKSHFCLLLKPQVVLRCEADDEAVCILAAVQGKLQTYGILDVEHVDDPISGKVMTRTFASINGLQTFSPSISNKGEGHVPLEVLVDLRGDTSLFDRLVPQTDAKFQYDKFNRLRLQMQNKSMPVARTSSDRDPMHDHLQNQTDLIRFHVPRFTVSANDRHFQAISSIVTKLLLFSDAASKTRTDKLDKMIFSYDFTNLSSAANVVANLQARLRHAAEMKKEAAWKLQGYGDDGRIEKLMIDAHVLMLAEELDLVFDAIRLAQEKAEDRASQKSALLLHASSSEISYQMLDNQDQLLAKLAIRIIDFYWLNRQDSSTVNTLSVGDLQAFDGAADAEWAEIVSKYEEKSNHPSVKNLVQKNLFLLADWTVLPPVGGITIYESFELTLHPIRLQIDTRVGRRIMEYVWPARKDRKQAASGQGNHANRPPPSPASPTSPRSPIPLISPRRNSADVVPMSPRMSLDSSRLAPPPMRRVHTSRSFTDLRNMARSDSLQPPRPLQRTRSTDMLFAVGSSNSSGQFSKGSNEPKDRSGRGDDDAAEMKYRSSQKTFIWVKVASLHLLLSIMKQDSFLCRDARIRTRDLEYRNQTWSFEELVDQFIPSGRNWKGWLKMAFQQPLVPVIPVARELISKTKWGGSKAIQHHHLSGPKRKDTAKRLPFLVRDKGSGTTREGNRPEDENPSQLLGIPFSTEPEPVTAVPIDKPKKPRARMLSMFKRQQNHPAQVRSSTDSDLSTHSTSSKNRSDNSIARVPSRPRTSFQSDSELIPGRDRDIS